MKTRILPPLIPRLALAGLLVALPTLAEVPPKPGAPTDQYKQFDRDSTVIEDNKTTLKWQRTAGAASHYNAAVSFCDLSFSLGRVPTVKELLTILDEQPHLEYDSAKVPPGNVAKMIDAQAFPDTSIDKVYWTSTDTGDGTTKWTVDFSTGLLKKMNPADAGDQVFFRCVR